MMRHASNRNFEDMIGAALSDSVRSTAPPESVWTGIQAGMSRSRRSGSKLRRIWPRMDGRVVNGFRSLPPARFVALAAVAVMLVGLGTWALLNNVAEPPATHQLASSAGSVQVWELGNGMWLTAGEELAYLSGDAGEPTPSSPGAAPTAGSPEAFLVNALMALPEQSFTVSSTARPFANTVQAMRFDGPVGEYLHGDGFRQLLDIRQFVPASGCTEVFRLEPATPSAQLRPLAVRPFFVPTPVITISKCGIIDRNSGAIVGETYYGPSSATSLGTFSPSGDVSLRKDSRPASPIPMPGGSVWGTITKWRIVDGRLERRTELDTDSPMSGAEPEWVAEDVDFKTSADVVDWLLATEFYAPIRRPQGSLLLEPFDSVELVEDAGLDASQVRLEATRENGPSGNEHWDVVVDVETGRPIKMSVATGNGEWQQSAEFEFSYP